MKKYRPLLFLFLVLSTFLIFGQDGINLEFPKKQIENALKENRSAPIIINFKIDEKLGSESYRIKPSKNKMTINGGDGKGLDVLIPNRPIFERENFSGTMVGFFLS
ncbi:hypothetical protein [Maribacter sp. 2210JD10-5]|uniref:hypothetical protein n=1 Tax=Maribacter sp. 2210JD10-5 TaxID=3386272 RepID=UPI0039BD06C9